VVGRDEFLRTKILHLVHDSPVAGHSSYQKTLHHAKHDFSWPGLRANLKQYVRDCDICQRQKDETFLPATLL
jgi:hypothetical protein